MKKHLSYLLILLALAVGCATDSQPDYMNTALSAGERAQVLVDQMTVDEKILQLGSYAPAIERLGLSEYNYQAEALHGLAEAAHGRLMEATSFPQSIAIGSSWNPGLMKEVATAISDEARAYNNAGEMDLTFWSPNINVLRDPRWGRNDEAYSEDPYLMSRMAVAFTQGMQGDHDNYLKTIVTPKHFVANNSEYNRHDGTSNVSERWLREYYFPAYKAAFQEGGAFSTMCAYNRVNEVPACGNEWLLTQVLRNEWGFEGYVVSDCGAISDIFHQHKFTDTQAEAVALAIKSGMDLECEGGGDEQELYATYIQQAIDEGFLVESDLDERLVNVLKGRILLGDMDPKEMNPYTSIDRGVIEGEAHQQLALKAARESIVLLKNDKELLPLSKDITSLAVIGPNANKVVLGAYSGKPTYTTSVYEGIRAKLGDQTEVFYEKGCSTILKDESMFEELEEWGKYVEDTEREEYEMMKAELEEEFAKDDDVNIADAVALAKRVDQVVLVMGTNRFVSNEESDAESLDWPGRQRELMKKVVTANPNVVLVLVNGFQITMDWEVENIPAIVETWYAGQAQGHAIADVLFGDYNPGGKLPVTWYQSENDLPHIGDYDITKGRTYWFFENDVIYPFGYGLSYTSFEYSDIQVNEDDLTVSFALTNTGEMKGEEVVQLYIRDMESSVVQPKKELRAFERVSLEAGENKRVTLDIDREDFMYWNEEVADWQIEAGDFEIQVGASSTDIKLSQTINVQ
ncbi:MAG: glycoside hydrolase family 3 C-terminal domain-containing protein [Bacteroidota bacterium]